MDYLDTLHQPSQAKVTPSALWTSWTTCLLMTSTTPYRTVEARCFLDGYPWWIVCKWEKVSDDL